VQQLPLRQEKGENVPLGGMESDLPQRKASSPPG
jgi:hypothetical protein